MDVSHSNHQIEHIVTDTQGHVIEMDLAPFNSIKDHVQLNAPIQEGFETWEHLSPQLIFALHKEKPFLLCLVKPNDTPLTTYFIFDGYFWLHALKEKETLKKEINELDAIIETSFDGIYLTDRNGVTLKTNAAIERITGIPKSYYIGKNINQLIQRGILAESVTVQVMERKHPVSMVQTNNQGKETVMTGSPIFNEKGEVDKIVTNIRDLSELNHLNEVLNRAKQLEQKKNKRKESGALPVPLQIKNQKMKAIYEMIERLASFDPTILILGETGVGKDRLVQHIYETGLRSEKGRLIKINCGAIPKDLIESELFGYDRGSFSGASRSGKPGLFELANQGLLFLDEIGEMPLDLQVRLLHVIQEKAFMRVGGTKPIKIDVQIIAATNKDLKKMVESGRFREDLYYRLNVVPIWIPPLRDRREDLKELAFEFLREYSMKYAVSKTFGNGVIERMVVYHWPGNVRELSNVVERLVLTVPTDEIQAKDLPIELFEQSTLQPSTHESLKELVEKREKEILIEAIQTHPTTYKLADYLKTSQATIVRKLKKYELKTSEG